MTEKQGEEILKALGRIFMVLCILTGFVVGWWIGWMGQLVTP